MKFREYCEEYGKANEENVAFTVGYPVWVGFIVLNHFLLFPMRSLILAPVVNDRCFSGFRIKFSFSSCVQIEIVYNYGREDND